MINNSAKYISKIALSQLHTHGVRINSKPSIKLPFSLQLCNALYEVAFLFTELFPKKALKPSSITLLSVVSDKIELCCG